MKASPALLALWPVLLLGGDVPAHHYQARLIGAVGSYTKPGTPVAARIVGSVRAGRDGRLPRGTIVSGSVQSARSIGLGVRHERARLEFVFDSCRLPDGGPVPCEAALVAVDNARERVQRPNQVEGILAASHPHSWLGGVWFRPVPALFRKAPTGLTGAGGMIYSRLAPSPFAAATIVGSRLFLFRLPDPEIDLPSGTEVILRVAAAAATANTTPAGRPSVFGESLSAAILGQPAEILQPDRNRAGDVINFAIEGSREALHAAFLAAGWTTAEPLNAKSFARTYSAFAAMKTYPNAPVSALYYQGRLPELVFQKSFNSLAKRHHIRLWSVEVEGRPLWLGAATHDVGIAFDWNRMSVTHRIDPHLDRERSKVLNDLDDAGCIADSELLPREALRRAAADRAPTITDGGLLAARLQDCAADVPSDSPSVKRPRRHFPVLAARRVILESRNYATRGNPYYWLYRAFHWRPGAKGSARTDDE